MALGTASSMSFFLCNLSEVQYLMSVTTTGYHNKFKLLRLLLFGGG